jgi:hypothetical protein
MGVISLKQSGDFKHMENFLKEMKRTNFRNIAEQYGQIGVDALSRATPIDSGTTAASWTYEIVDSGDSFDIYWNNTNENKGVNIAIILQYGHGTGTGGYVQGRDYINPAIQPVFDQMTEELWKMVTSA